ncbi:Chromatin associated protein [Mycena kentingensis (nom. inval.)]|nr:Chromatin associated protein [Mycena kentingensis (nom. inval.)]
MAHRPGPGHVSAGLGDALEIIKSEFELLSAEVAVARRERDECEATLTSQVNELNLIRQSLYELETQHGKLRHQYEEDLARLRAELQMVRQGLPPPPPGPAPQLHNVPGPGHPAQPPLPLPGPGPGPDYRMVWRDRERDRERVAPDRERERERDRERERERDPKRHKLERGRSGPTLSIPAMPPVLVSPSTPIPIPPPPPAVFLDDHDLATLPPHLKKEGVSTSATGATEWFVVWNPSIKPKRIADITLLHTLLHESVVCCVRFSRDGRWLATGCNRTAQVFDARTGVKVCSLMDPAVPKGGDLYIRSVCFSPDGALLATGAEDTQIRIWDIAKKRIIAVLSGHQQEIYALDFSTDGRFVVSGSGDKTVRVWDMRIVNQNLNAPPNAPALGTPGAPPVPCRVLVIDEPPSGASVQNANTNTKANANANASSSGATISASRTSPGPAPDGGVTSVAVSPSGTRVAAGALDALVRVWDVRTGQLVRRLRGHGDSVYSVAFVPSADGMAAQRSGMALVSGGLDRTVRGWDLGLPVPGAGASVSGSGPGPSPVLQGWKEPGSTLGLKQDSVGAPLKGWKDKDVRERDKDGAGTEDVDGGRCMMTFMGHKDYVLSVAVSHDGEWVVSGSKDRGVQFWDARTGVVQCMLQGHKNSVISIDLSPAGNCLATGSGDWHTRIWSYDVVA